MLYKFKSKAGGDVIMLGADGDRLMHIIGREPDAQGILLVADMPAALRALEAAVLADERAPEPSTAGDTEAGDEARVAERAGFRVALRQRAWPLMDLIRRALSAEHDVLWGV